MPTKMPRLGQDVTEALTKLDTFRPTEAAILRREITKLRRMLTNRDAPAVILPGDLTDLAAHLDTTRQRWPGGKPPARAYVDAVLAAGWVPERGTT